MKSSKGFFIAFVFLFSLVCFASGAEVSKADLIFEAKTPKIHYKAGQDLVLEIGNKGEAKFEGVIQLHLPQDMVKRALSGIVFTDGVKMLAVPELRVGKLGWTAWLHRPLADADADLRITIRNDRDKDGKEIPQDARVGISHAETLTFTVPLEEPRVLTSYEILTSYGNTSTSQDASSRKKIQVTVVPSAQTADIPVSALIFRTNQESPTALPLGRKVELSWKIPNAVSATLVGPLPGGFNEKKLSGQELAEGSLNLQAVGPVKYILKANVRNGGVDQQIQKIVDLDIYSPDKTANLFISPAIVLPNGKVTVSWAASGLAGRNLNLIWTNQDGYRQVRALTVNDMGFGKETFIVPKDAVGPEDTSVKLEVNAEAVEKRFEIAKWQSPKSGQWPHLDGIPGVTSRKFDEEKPRALVYVAPKKNTNEGTLVLCTDKGVWTAEAGIDEPFSRFAPFIVNLPDFKECLSAVALPNGFGVMVLGTKGVELFIYAKTGSSNFEQRGTASTWIDSEAKDIQMVAVKDRIYVKSAAKVYSINWAAAESGDRWVHEKMLSDILGGEKYALIALNESLYAFNGTKGMLLRFPVGEKQGSGTLHVPKNAAVDGTNNISLSGAIPVNIGGILALVGAHPAEPQSEASKGGVVQDMAYNPQTNKWSYCGHGLDILPGAVAAYRSEGAPRLWVIQPKDGTAGTTAHTLAVDSPRMFADDYLDGNKAVETDYYGNKAEFKIKFANDNGFTLRPMDGAHIKQGLAEYEFDKPAYAHATLDGAKKESMLTLHYNPSHLPAGRFRWLIDGVDSQGGYAYVLELKTHPSEDGKKLTATTAIKRYYGIREISTLAESRPATVVPALERGSDPITLEIDYAALKNRFTQPKWLVEPIYFGGEEHPRALAYVPAKNFGDGDARLVLCTDKNLWWARLKIDEIIIPKFESVKEGKEPCLNVVTLPSGFAMLQPNGPSQTVVLGRFFFGPDGSLKRPGPGIVLPPVFADTKDIQIAEVKGRIYVRNIHSAYSIDLNKLDDWTEEKRLSDILKGDAWDLQTLADVGDSLFAINRNTRALMRFPVADAMDKGGSLSLPKTSRAFTLQDASDPIGPGVPVGLDGTLAMLSGTPKGGGKAFDFVYNPKSLRRSDCAHHLDVDAGAVAAYRGEGAPVLWVIQDGKQHALAVDSPLLCAAKENQEGMAVSEADYLDKKIVFDILGRRDYQIKLKPLANFFTSAESGGAEIDHLFRVKPIEYPGYGQAGLSLEYNSSHLPKGVFGWAIDFKDEMSDSPTPYTYVLKLGIAPQKGGTWALEAEIKRGLGNWEESAIYRSRRVFSGNSISIDWTDFISVAIGARHNFASGSDNILWQSGKMQMGKGVNGGSTFPDEFDGHLGGRKMPNGVLGESVLRPGVYAASGPQAVYRANGRSVCIDKAGSASKCPDLPDKEGDAVTSLLYSPENGRLFVGANGYVHSYNEDGDDHQSNHLKGMGEKEVRLAYSNSRIIVGTNGHVWAFDAKNLAQPLWTNSMKDSGDEVTSVASDFGNVYAGTNGHVVKLTKDGYELKRVSNLDRSEVRLALEGGLLIVGNNGWVRAFDTQTMTEVWQVELMKSKGAPAVRIRFGAVYAALADKVFKLDANNGTLRGVYTRPNSSSNKTRDSDLYINDAGAFAVFPDGVVNVEK